MRIMHVIVGLQTGGAERMLFRLVAAHKAQCQTEHLVISLTGGGPTKALLEGCGIKVFCCGATLLNFPLAFCKLYRLIRWAEPDLVQTWMYHSDLLGGLAARLAGVKCIIWGVRSGDVAASGFNLTVLIRSICAFLSSRLPSAIVFASYKSLRIHTDLGYSCKAMQVISNGFDFADSDRVADITQSFKTQELGVVKKASTRIVTLVAREHPIKGVPYFIDAASLLAGDDDGYFFIFVGRGLDRNNVKLVEQIRKGALITKCSLLGERSDVLEVLAHSDLCCMASLSESFPNVVVEAMSVGTPCVVTDVGDAAIIVGDAGFVVQPGDSQGICKAINHYFQLPITSRRQLRREAKQRVIEEYSMERCIEQFDNLYNRVLCEQDL